mmetsp:Transcript_10713/g.16515  ORF Transcript_10713/g.16515 Transcript_10713/m.16515 type:complete len:408 (+) Transcript_10713:221-1444(+)
MMTFSRKTTQTLTFCIFVHLAIICSSVCSASVFIPRHVAIGISNQKNNKLNNHNNDSVIQSSGPSVMKNVRRGGASAIAAAKTMTANQMQAFNLLSGGVAGTIAAAITNPLEVVKTQLQCSSTSSAAHGGMASGRGHPMTIAQKIMAQDGVSGFFRGLPPTLVGIIPSRSAYFYCYTQCKNRLDPWLPQGSPGNAMASGLAAGIAGNTLTNPIWMVRTRMQILADTGAGQRMYNGYRDAISTIFREEGLGGFYRGIFASYWGCIEGSIQFLIYEQIKSRSLARVNAKRESQGLPPTDHLSKMAYFSSAACAKCIASIATYPHEVARTRLREQARDGIFKYHGMWQTIGLIGREEGRAGLYAGMGVHLMKVVPNSAIMFLTYELVNKWLGQFTIVDTKDEVAVVSKRR